MSSTVAGDQPDLKRVGDAFRLEPGPSPSSTTGIVPLPGDRPIGRSRARVDEEMASLRKRLVQLHDVFMANERRMLVVLQGLDASGKSGVTRHVFGALNPVGLRVAAFKQPTRAERERHFLWRIRQQLPDNGEITVFDRSHYEDLLVPLARGTVDRRALAARVRAINHFESALVENGTVVLKCFLHMSPEVQRDRFVRRLERPEKHWKFSDADLDTRDRWGAFSAALADVIPRTTTSAAPWYVVPADRKWYRNWVVANLVVEALADLDLQYPPLGVDKGAALRRLGVT